MKSIRQQVEVSFNAVEIGETNVCNTITVAGFCL